MSVPSQLLSSSSHQSVSAHQILPESLSSYTTSPSKTPYRDKALSIDVVWLSIFAFLPPYDVVKNICYVKRKWRDLTRFCEVNFWRARCPHGVRYEFNSSVIQSLESGKDVYLYTRLSPFVARIMENRHSWPDFIHLKNSELTTPHPFSHLNQIMPQPFTKYGDYHFAICNLTDIEVNKKGNSEPFFLKGEKKKKLTHIAAEWNYVFVLGDNGIIDQWDCEQRKKVGEIPTVYSTRNEKLKQKEISNRAFCDKFYIKNGIIIIVYEKDPRILTRTLEIISYEDPEKGLLIEKFPLVSNLIFIEVLEDHQIIIMGSDFASRHAIWKIKLSNPESDTQSIHPSSWTALSQHSLERITDTSRNFSIIDIKTGKAAYSADSLEHIYMVQTCIVIESLVFSFFFMLERLYVDVIRVDGENAWRVHRLEEPLVPLYSDHPTWWFDFQKRLLAIARRELHEFVPPILAPPKLKSPFKPKPKLKPEPLKPKSKGCVLA